MAELLACLGEILIDFLPIEENGATVGFRMHPGGSIMNVAVGLARLDRHSAFVGKVAGDFFGRTLRAFVEGESVDTRYLLSSDALSTLAFVAHENGEPVFNFYGEGAADALLTPDELPEALFEEASSLHVGGISLLRGTTPAAALAACERLRRRALLSIDPNIRPGLVRDEAAYRALLERIFPLVDVVKVSAADLRWLAPGVDAAEAARALLQHGPALIVLTRGGEGVAAFRSPDAGRSVEVFEQSIFRVEVADTVGAGDAFMAGVLAGLAERSALSRQAVLALPGAEIDATLRFASAVAALACTRPGANPPHRAEVAAFLANL